MIIGTRSGARTRPNFINSQLFIIGTLIRQNFHEYIFFALVQLVHPGCAEAVKQEIEIRPGIVGKDEQGNIKCTPIYSRIVSLFAEDNELQFAVPVL